MFVSEFQVRDLFVAAEAERVAHLLKTLDRLDLRLREYNTLEAIGVTTLWQIVKEGHHLLGRKGKGRLTVGPVTYAGICELVESYHSYGIFMGMNLPVGDYPWNAKK